MKKTIAFVLIMVLLLSTGCGSSSEQAKEDYFKQYCNLVEVAKEGYNRIYCDMNTGNLYLYMLDEGISPIYDEYGKILKYQDVHKGEE